MRMHADLCGFIKPGSGTTLFLTKECNKKTFTRNNPLHVKTNTNICPRRAQKTNKGQDAPDRKGLSFGLRKHHKVLKPRGHTMHQHRTLVYRSPRGGVVEGSFGLIHVHASIGLPLAAHGNPTGIHYTGAHNIFSLGRSGNGRSMHFLGRGRNCQSFSGFKFFRIHLEATLEGEKLKISGWKKEKRITRDWLNHHPPTHSTHSLSPLVVSSGYSGFLHQKTHLSWYEKGSIKVRKQYRTIEYRNIEYRTVLLA